MTLFNALLHLYPRSFRADYGDEMRAIFRKRHAATAGAGARGALWAETMADVIGNATCVHADLLAQDVRYALRTLSRAKGFAITAILVAALGIGATTASFSVADHVLLRPLPFPESDRLVRMWQDQTFRGYPRMELSPSNFLDWKQAATTVSGMAAYTTRSTNLVGQGDPERLEGALVSGDLFAVLGVQALLGRAIVLDDQPYVVVGVMPPGFEFPTRDVEIWTTFRFTPEALEDRSNTYLSLVARMQDEATIEQVRSEMRAIAADLERRFPKENAQTSASVHLLRDQVSAQARTLLVTLVAAALCMLLIACANLANLLVARALTRERELAVRAAIGANRDRLVRQMLTEGGLVAVIGGVLGIALAAAAVPLVARLVPNTLPVADTPGLDLRMLAVAAIVTIGTGLGFAVLPARRMSRSLDA